jgi:hypothetical protein
MKCEIVTKLPSGAVELGKGFPSKSAAEKFMKGEKGCK